MRVIGQNGTNAGAMYSPRLVKEVLKALGKQLVDDGRLDSVSLYSAGPTADFLELEHTRMARRRLRSARKCARPNQCQGREKRGNRLGVEAKSSLTTSLKANARNGKAEKCRQIHFTRDFFSTFLTLCTHHIVAQGSSCRSVRIHSICMSSMMSRV